MSDAHTGTLDLSEGEMQPQRPVAPNASRPQGDLAKMRTIILEDHDDIPPSGQPFGINGYVYLLKPGVEAKVPQAIINILNDAIISTPVVDSRTRKVVGHRNRLRFPYRTLD